MPTNYNNYETRNDMHNCYNSNNFNCTGII